MSLKTAISCTLDSTFKSTALPPGCQPACRGCPHREMSVAQSLDEKQSYVESQLQTYTNCIEQIRSNTLNSRWHQRTRATLRAKWLEGAWQFGFLDRDNNLINLKDCPAHSLQLGQIIRALTLALPKDPALPLAFLVINREIVSLVLKCQFHEVATQESFRNRLEMALLPLGVKSLFLNFNPGCGQRVFRHSTAHSFLKIFGADTALLELPRVGALHYGATTFLQQDLGLFDDALWEATRFLNPSPSDAVVDLYSGIGCSLKHWSRRGIPSIGVELTGESVTCSELNLDSKSKVLRGRTEDRVPQIQKFLSEVGAKEKFLFANPTRLGLDPPTMKFVLGERWERMAYLSCNPRSLADDLAQITPNGYEVVMMIPFDFIPNTRQVEVLCLIRARVKA